MTYRLTKRNGTPTDCRFKTLIFSDFNDCIDAALANDDDFVVESGADVIDYRISGVRKSN